VFKQPRVSRPQQLHCARLQVNQVLNKARDDAGRYAQASLRDTNNVVRMVTAGSKVPMDPQQTLSLQLYDVHFGRMQDGGCAQVDPAIRCEDLW
jgi:uncharacterized protein YcbK (DUF882 family)